MYLSNWFYPHPQIEPTKWEKDYWNTIIPTVLFACYCQMVTSSRWCSQPKHVYEHRKYWHTLLSLPHSCDGLKSMFDAKRNPAWRPVDNVGAGFIPARPSQGNPRPYPAEIVIGFQPLFTIRRCPKDRYSPLTKLYQQGHSHSWCLVGRNPLCARRSHNFLLTAHQLSLSSWPLSKVL